MPTLVPALASNLLGKRPPSVPQFPHVYSVPSAYLAGS